MHLKTLQDAFAYFSDRQRCVDYVINIRWPDGKASCPTCGSEAVTWLPTRFLYQCKGKHPKRQFSVKVGTLMEDSPIPLGDWLLVGWLLGSCRNGISSYEVARTIGITQKSAWFMLHRLRRGMRIEGKVLRGTVEADETHIGGIQRNKHVRKRLQKTPKTVVFGMVERGGRVQAEVIPEANRNVVAPIIKQHVDDKAMLYTDSSGIYERIRNRHDVINHIYKEYTFDRGYGLPTVHTNTIENFWSCLKRTIKGTYVSVSPKHLDSYVQEQAFRFNVRRGFSEEQRSLVLMSGLQGRRLTYKELTARPA